VPAIAEVDKWVILRSQGTIGGLERFGGNLHSRQ